MDDAHAHPPSAAHTLHVRSRSIPPSLRDYPTDHTTPKSAPHTRQQRLLQTRHARFSAQRLSVNGISVPFPQLNRGTENDPLYFSSPRFNKRDENDRDPNKTEKLSKVSTESAILNEITNFNAYRIRGLKRRSAIPVFQDSPDKHSVPASGANTPSIYHDASSDIQPPSIPDSLQDNSLTMGLREVSINLQRPSPHRNSPYYRSMHGGLTRKSSQPKTRFNSDEYIEHIENELEMVKDAMYSPTTHLPWKEKLKKAKEDNNQLKKEMDLMKSSFEFELHDTVERFAETEQKLKRRIKDLEDEVELNQTVIHDLQCDREEKRFDQNALDVLKARIEKLEQERFSLEATNRDMTKRNEVLTQLLALSPTKTQPSIELPTPRRRSTRPMSLIIPRVPSSPGVRTSQSRPHSVLASPALAISDYFPAQMPSSPFASSPMASGGSPGINDDARSIDSGLGESCAPIASGTGSRRSTLASHTSTISDVHIGGHIRAESRSQTVLRHPSRRRPRKFMPGSTQLKPLLLPTFTADNGNLPSTSPVTSPIRPFPVQLGSQMNGYELATVEQTATRDYGEPPFSSPENVDGRQGPVFQSLDEVFADDEDRFQPGALEDTPDRHSFSNHLKYQTPIQSRNPESTSNHESRTQSGSSLRISSWVLKTISSLPEDPESNPLYEDKTVTQAMLQQSRGGPDYGKVFDQRDDPSDFNALPMLPLKDNVEIPRPLFSKHRMHIGGRSLSSSGYPESPLNPRKRRKTSSTYEISGSRTAIVDGDLPNSEPGSTECKKVSPSSSVVERQFKHLANEKSAVPEKQDNIRARSPLEMLQYRDAGTRPLATLSIQTVYATLSRYTTYIQGFKRDPLALARRVIANAWRSNWAIFGKLSWWVLGLFVGYRRPEPDRLEWDWETYDGECIANRCCSSDVGRHSANGSSQSECQTPSNLACDSAMNPGNTAMKQVTSSAIATREPKSGWARSLYLWGKFSVAIMLAVGGAIVKGPAEMLHDAEDHGNSQRNTAAAAEND